MADIDLSGSSSGGGGHKSSRGVKKAKKLSTRVDMTPMVDLGFLLITFFIFTTTMASPTAMKLNMPDDTAKDEEQNQAKASGAFTVMLGDNNRIYYYEGQLAPDGSNFKTTNFKNIRGILIDKKKRTPENDLVVVIKPSPKATFKNTVDMLDEMTINEIKRFALVDISPVEQDLINVTDTAGGAAPATTN